MKKRIRLLAAMAAALALAGGTFAMTQTVRAQSAAQEKHFTATILDVRTGSILVEPAVDEEDPWVANVADQIVVSLTGFKEADNLSLATGDVVEISFDGSIAETYPAQIVCITGLEIVEHMEGLQSEQPAEHATTTQTGADWPALVMVQGTLYRDSGQLDNDGARCGMMDGSITQECVGTPTEDGQSNFGIGYGWQYGRTDAQIEILIDGDWHVFVAVDQE